jgi:two-component system nitrate/nitrite response regulator NarL
VASGGAEPARRVSVLVVDDHEIFRRAAASVIAAAPGFELVGEAASGPEGLELAADLGPNLVLVDVRMPGMDGIETARRLASSDPAVTVILISLEELPELPASATSGGALACLRKQDFSPRTLRDTWAAHRAR